MLPLLLEIYKDDTIILSSDDESDGIPESDSGDRQRKYKYKDHEYTEEHVLSVETDDTMVTDMGINPMCRMLMDVKRDVYCFNTFLFFKIIAVQSGRDPPPAPIDIYYKSHILFPTFHDHHWVLFGVDLKQNSFWCYNSLGWSAEQKDAYQKYVDVYR